MLPRLRAQAVRAAAKPSGNREWRRDKGKITPAVSRFEDLSRRLISLGCGFKIKFVQYNSPNVYGVFLVGYFHVK